jgi:diketogulonate reductase-like aldo/keto reductase
MFADPQTITVNSDPKVMNAVVRGDYKSLYRSPQGVYALRIEHDIQAKKERHLVEFSRKDLVTNPYSTLQQDAILKVQLVIDNPNWALIADTEIVFVVNAFLAWLTASSSVAVTKILGNES